MSSSVLFGTDVSVDETTRPLRPSPAPPRALVPLFLLTSLTLPSSRPGTGTTCNPDTKWVDPCSSVPYITVRPGRLLVQSPQSLAASTVLVAEGEEPSLTPNFLLRDPPTGPD